MDLFQPWKPIAQVSAKEAVQSGIGIDAQLFTHDIG